MIQSAVNTLLGDDAKEAQKVLARTDILIAERQICGRHRVDRAVISGKPMTIVATCFLGHDNGLSGDRPLPWETSIAGGPLDGQDRQYATVGAVDLMWEAMEQGSSA